MKKISTQIPGLDTLLHGGVQLYTSTENRNKQTATYPQGKSALDSLVIVIKGAKGVFKTDFAIHLMHGLTVSMKSSDQKPCKGKALLYSINKDKADLNDTYLDFIIAQFLDMVVVDYRKQKFNAKRDCDDIKGRYNIDALLQFIFDFDNKSRDNAVQSDTAKNKDYILNHLCRLVCEGIINYNPRTNSLHFMRNFSGDDHRNLVATRRKESVAEYIKLLNDGERNTLLSTCKDGIAGEFIKSLITLEVNDHEDKDKSISPNANFRAIENDLYEKWYHALPTSDEEKKQLCNEDGTLKEQPYDCVVIDGFSQLSTKDLSEIPSFQFTDFLRKLSKISILVFDEREEARCDGDIVIEMKEDYDNDESYMSHSLRIAKCIFQTAVLGWHQYKKRDYGIAIFPSQHLHLSKRFYIQNKSKHIGQSIFESSVLDYLDAKNYRDCIDGIVDDCQSRQAFRDFIDNERLMEKCLHDRIYKDYANTINKLSEEIEQIRPTVQDEYTANVKDIMEDILCFNFPPRKEDDDESTDCNDSHCGCLPKNIIRTDHFPCTVIIGNPNSYKRTFALATAHKLACLEHPVHTLFILFDKNELDMRTRMVCPAFYGDDTESRINKCRICSRFIHTYNMRMGCITPNEFFTILQEQISFYCKTSEETGNEHSWMHIVIDDIQKIQFSFPFLRDTKLFLSALMDICRQNKVKLTILCDKNSELTREVSSIADNVIDIRRDEEDIYSVEFNIERRLRERVPSRIVRLKISDILHLFRCKGRDMHIAFSTKDDDKDKTTGKSIYQKFLIPKQREDAVDDNDNSVKANENVDSTKTKGSNADSTEANENVNRNDANSNADSEEANQKGKANPQIAKEGTIYRVTPKLIGSMKGYWRKTENVIPQKNN